MFSALRRGPFCRSDLKRLTDFFLNNKSATFEKKSNNEKIKSLFDSVNSNDKEFIDVLIRKLVFSLGVKKYYEHKYKIRI